MRRGGEETTQCCENGPMDMTCCKSLTYLAHVKVIVKYSRPDESVCTALTASLPDKEGSDSLALF